MTARADASAASAASADFSAYTYRLPSARIALTPARPRSAARLLVLPPPESGEALDDRRIADLPQILRAGDMLVVNDTQVLPHYLPLARQSGGRVALTLIAPLPEPDTKPESKTVRWRAFLRPARKVKIGETLQFGRIALTLVSRQGREAVVEFACSSARLAAALKRHGQMPLPPYIASRRAPAAQDRKDYQTMFARAPGALAAPTAGLHFTPALCRTLRARGIEFFALRLHVGVGTFAPLTQAQWRQKKLAAEWGELSAEMAAALNRGRAEGRRLIAVGTTSLRLLESAADKSGRLSPFCGTTDLMIAPGRRCRASDGLLTNFHLPRSSLFVLVCAYGGTARLKAAYAHAIRQKYRFYSYGDACLIAPC